MILVDTSVWIDHLHHADADLTLLLDRNQVATHELVIGELALGSIARRAVVLDSLSQLRRVPRVSHDELLAFVAEHVDEAPARPKAVTILDAMPMTNVGKIYKPELRQIAAQAAKSAP